MRLIGDKPMSGAERQRRHRAKMVARRALVTRSGIDLPDIDPALRQFVMTSSELSERFGGLPVLSEAEYAAFQAIPGALDPVDEDEDGDESDSRLAAGGPNPGR